MVPRVGVIVNPIAGMGGPVALHGTDGGAEVRARALGALPGSEERMRRALLALRAAYSGEIEVVAADGVMGADSVKAVGLELSRTVGVVADPTTAQDTRAAAIAICEFGVDLLLFAGGDGTASDIVSAIGTSTTLLGTPSGVKMHSGVFAHTPERAGIAAAEYLRTSAPRATEQAEVLDVAIGQADLSNIGVAQVPKLTSAMQGPKVVRTDNAIGDLRALGRQIAASMQPGATYVLGPGTTVGTILTALGIEGTRNGFDVVVDGAAVITDASEAELFEHLSQHSGSILVLGVVGGQGFLLGRGNQQVSPRVLDLIDDENIIVVAAQNKIDALHPPVLHVDLGQPEPHAALWGYRRVRTSPTRSTVLRIKN
ncbi:MAG: NAD(+)/NADH kinase [Homoserinimonas sp.]